MSVIFFLLYLVVVMVSLVKNIGTFESRLIISLLFWICIGLWEVRSVGRYILERLSNTIDKTDA